MKIGYSYWGFLGDVKVDANGNLLANKIITATTA